MQNSIIENGKKVKADKLKGIVINFDKNSKNNIVEIGKNYKKRGTGLVINIKGQNHRVIIGDNCSLCGRFLLTGFDTSIKIGDGTTFQGCYLLARDESITIGKNCMFSREIEIRASDVHKVISTQSGIRLNEARSVNIGDHVWIAAKCFISKGAKIPNDSIVGACSFVNKEFYESNIIIAGSPAKVVKRNINWER